MKILALPRDPNPYQGLLYDEAERLGAEVHYLGELTPSHTLNVLLLPAELVIWRARGAQFVHLHWVWIFSLPAARLRASRWLSQAWFRVFLATARVMRLRVAWTAHNVFPHSPVFSDDAAARRVLVRHCEVVFAHSDAALEGLAGLGARPRRSLVIRHGPMGPATSPELRVPGSSDGPREFLFFGNVARYKGVTDLIAAFGALPAGCDARLTIAGRCDDEELRAQLRESENIRLRLAHIPEQDVADLLASADVVVLPFRQVTTSGSAELALGHGRPLIIPDLPGLAGLPAAAVIRYDGSVPGLAAALADLATVDKARLAAMAAAARDYSGQASWREIALATLAALESARAGRDQEHGAVESASLASS